MKHFLAIVLSLSLLLCLTGCKNNTDKEDKIKVVSTIFCEYDFVRAVAGEAAENIMLMPPGGDMHSYEPTFADIANISDCDLFLYIGGESDTYVEKILSAGISEKTKVLKMMDFVTPISEEEEGHHGYDEHIWTSPENAKKMVDAICTALCEIDVTLADTFKANAQQYNQSITEVETQTANFLNSCENPFLVVADRFPYAYFAKHYNLPYKAAFGGCETNTDADLLTVTSLIDCVKQNGVSAVFYTELSSRKVADVVSENAGVQALELHSAHNISADDFANGVTYVDLMQRNLQALKRGFGK